MDYISRYVHEVTRRLPEEMQEDVALELQSTIEDMLPEDDYTEEDVKRVLETLGNPVVLASRYRDRPSYLIGPALFDSYLSVLKIVMPITLAVGLISLLAAEIVQYSGEVSLPGMLFTLFGLSIGAAIEIAIQVFFWVTIVFVILERTVPSDKIPESPFGQKWSPDLLKHQSIIPKKRAISLWEVMWSLLWTAIWASVYFNASNLIALYNFEGEQNVSVTSLLNQEVLISYWPFVVFIIGTEIALAVYKWITREWTKKLAAFNAFSHLLFILVFSMMVTNGDLFHSSVLDTIASHLNSDPSQILLWFQLSTIVTFIIIAVIDTYEGFRKATKELSFKKKMRVRKN